MEKMDYWRLCDELSVVNAALLVAGLDPSDYPGVIDWNEFKSSEGEERNRPKEFYPAFHAISNAVFSERLKSNIEETSCDPNIIRPFPDWDRITVFVDDLKDWLRGRGFKTGFFFPETGGAPDYLDTNHKHYAPKLAAAVNAWEAVNAEPKVLRGKTVKQALEIWLRKNAGQYGLTKDDGNPNEQGINEIAKISNWDVKGGAPKTPG